MSKIKVSIAGGDGYTGGELTRLLLSHPYVELKQITSERLAGKFIFNAHPNLRKNTLLKFCKLAELEACDTLFLCLPHGKSMQGIETYKKLSPAIIDLASDFRLKNPSDYDKWYNTPHTNPAVLKEFTYGIPELYREKIKVAKLVACAGCNATATILALYPLFKNNVVELDRTVVEVKVGSSEGGRAATESSHHPERSGCLRSYMPTHHRHVAEIIQELSFGKTIQVHFSATSVDMVRGILATSHVFLKEPLDEKTIWGLYRKEYSKEPFIRIVKEAEGIYRYPEPKLLIGTNYCDIGFERDMDSNRLVVISAIDNLMKGGASQGVQTFNVMNGFDEKEGLGFPGLHPI